jgi:hypothetical protein
MVDAVRLFAVSAVVMGLSHTLTKERLFAWLRNRLGDRDTNLGYLVSCPYCVSHYIAFALVPVTETYPIQIAHDWGLVSDALTWFLSSILVTVVAAFLRIIFYFVDEKQSLTRFEKEHVRHEDEQLLHSTTPQRHPPFVPPGGTNEPSL